VSRSERNASTSSARNILCIHLHAAVSEKSCNPGKAWIRIRKCCYCISWYKNVTKSFRTGRLERELQTVQLSATRWNCIAILWVSPVSFAATTLCVASQWVIPKISVYFVIDSVRKLLDTSSNIHRRKLSLGPINTAISLWTCSFQPSTTIQSVRLSYPL
jgi:hypothetical protein